MDVDNELRTKEKNMQLNISSFKSHAGKAVSDNRSGNLKIKILKNFKKQICQFTEKGRLSVK